MNNCEIAELVSWQTKNNNACELDATRKLEAYTGGIFEEYSDWPSINHIISVAGWGVEAGSKLLRNTW